MQSSLDFLFHGCLRVHRLCVAPKHEEAPEFLTGHPIKPTALWLPACLGPCGLRTCQNVVFKQLLLSSVKISETGWFECYCFCLPVTSPYFGNSIFVTLGDTPLLHCFWEKSLPAWAHDPILINKSISSL